MSQYKSLLVLFIILLFSCDIKAQLPDNTKPMYGEVAKNDEYKAIDEKFINRCLEQFGSLDSSVNVHIDHAWRYFFHNDLKTAMKRFNQAWLLDANNPDSYFGFAALLTIQGDKNAAKRFYKIGQEKDITNTREKRCNKRENDCLAHIKELEAEKH